MEKGLVLKLRLFIFIMAASSACFGPFLPVYFNSRNLTYTQIGIAFSISAIAGVVLQPMWGYISDRYLNKKKALIAAIGANMLVIVFFIWADSFSAIIILIILNNIFMCGINPITDAYTFDVIDEVGGLNYSNFRFMASAAWGMTNLILGYVIKAYDINYSFIIYEIIAVIGLGILIVMRYEGKKSHTKAEFKDVKVILKNYRLMMMLLTVFLMNAAFIAGVNYMNEIIRFTGGDVSKLGMNWFITCMFEVLTFFVAGKFMNKIGVMNTYFISILIYGGKFILDFILKDANLIIAVQVLEGIAFALFITSSLEYLNIGTEEKVRATAMSLYAASGGLGAFCSSLISGMLLNKINPSQLYGVLGVVCFIAFLFALNIEKRNRSFSV